MNKWSAVAIIGVWLVIGAVDIAVVITNPTAAGDTLKASAALAALATFVIAFFGD